MAYSVAYTIECAVRYTAKHITFEANAINTSLY